MPPPPFGLGDTTAAAAPDLCREEGIGKKKREEEK